MNNKNTMEKWSKLVNHHSSQLYCSWLFFKYSNVYHHGYPPLFPCFLILSHLLERLCAIWVNLKHPSFSTSHRSQGLALWQLQGPDIDTSIIVFGLLPISSNTRKTKTKFLVRLNKIVVENQGRRFNGDEAHICIILWELYMIMQRNGGLKKFFLGLCYFCTLKSTGADIWII